MTENEPRIDPGPQPPPDDADPFESSMRTLDRQHYDDGDFPLSTLRRVTVNRPGRPQEAFALRLPAEAVEELRQRAEARGVGVTQLPREWIFAQMVKHLPAGDLAKTVGEALAWTSYLSDEGRKELVTELPAVIQHCEDLGTFAPLETFMASWRSTAAVMADPELADRLSLPVSKPSGKRATASSSRPARAPLCR